MKTGLHLLKQPAPSTLPDDPYDLITDPVEKFHARLHDALAHRRSRRSPRPHCQASTVVPRLGKYERS